MAAAGTVHARALCGAWGAPAHRLGGPELLLARGHGLALPGALFPLFFLMYVAPGGALSPDCVGLTYYLRVIMDWRCQAISFFFTSFSCILAGLECGIPLSVLHGVHGLPLLARGHGLALPWFVLLLDL